MTEKDLLITIKNFDNKKVKKNVQIKYLNSSIIIKKNYLKIISISLSILLLNIFFKKYLLVFLVQFTVGSNSNMLWLHDPYIKECIIDCDLKIPKIIHQTYKSFDEIPDRWKNSPKLWKQYHPGWEYKFWSDKDIDIFMKQNYPWFTLFNEYPNFIQKVDVSRYFILYHYGGIYSDMDIAPKENLENLISNYNEIVVKTPNVGLTNSLMMSEKHSELMEYVIHHLDKYNHGWYYKFIPNHLRILFSTGSTAFWAMYSRFTSQNYNNIGILNVDYFGRSDVCKSRISRNAKFIHEEGNSWHTGTGEFINLIGCNPITFGFFILSFISICVCWTRLRRYRNILIFTNIFLFLIFIIQLNLH